MGAPLGNKNASRENRQFRNSLNRNLKRFKAEGVPDGDALGKITQKLIQCAINGEAWAIKEVADRLEGKAPQAIGIAEVPDAISLTWDQGDE
jgi:hypothetical protein|tara:strand:+ start:3980 stop:4255 length:276 start_codon:yes stop_codon:yes gene_type:complete